MTQTHNPLKKSLINLILASIVISFVLIATSSQSAKLIKANILTMLEKNGVTVPETEALAYKFPLGITLKRASFKLAGNQIECSDITLTPVIRLSGAGFSANASAYGGSLIAHSIIPANNFSVGSFELNGIDISRISHFNGLGIVKGSMNAKSTGGSLESLPFEINVNNLTFPLSSSLDSTNKVADLVLESVAFKGSIEKDQASGILSGKGPAGSLKGDILASSSNLQLKGELVLTDYGARTIGPFLALFGASNASSGEPFAISLRGSPQSPRISVTRKNG